MTEATAFTAAELSLALGVTPQRVRQLLKNCRSSLRYVAGQPTQAWRLYELPKKVMDRLERASLKTGSFSVLALLRNAAPRWEPALSLAMIEEKQMAVASLRREALSPVLAAKKGKPVSLLITEAIARFSELGGEVPSESTLRRLIMTAIERDHGHEEWGRVHIYLDDRLAPRDLQAEPPPEACRLPALAVVLDSVGNPDDPGKERLTILKVAMDEMKRLQGEGLSLELARASVVDTVAASGVRLSPSREALRKLIRRSWDKWMAGGQMVESLEDRPRSGRPPLVMPTIEESNALKTLNHQTGSISLAARLFSTRQECSPKLKDAIQKERSSKHKIPPTIKKAAMVIPVERAFYKSPKKALADHFSQPRNFDFLHNGCSERIRPGQLFERDDMSINCLFWVPWPWGGDPCSERYGVRICRGQLLVSLDVGSQRFLSFNLLARTMDSYRADDIWAWIGHDYSSIGMPGIGERLERGIWKARKISGNLSVAWDEKSTIEQAKRIGGLASLGVAQITAHSPSAKEIERRFHTLQNVMGEIPGQIGRHRGEMEKETKIWMACQSGKKDPREHFITYSAMLEEVQKALLFCNADRHEGKHVYGIPDKLWEESGAWERLRKLPEGKAFLFARDRSELTVKKGSIQIRRKNPDGLPVAWWFSDYSLHDYEGQKLQVYYDSLAPEAGASIVDWKDQLLCHAPLIDGCPQFSLDNVTRDETSLERRKKFRNAVVSECRILDPRPDQKKKIMARISDGRGNETISTGEETASRLFPDNAVRKIRPGDDTIRQAYLRRNILSDEEEEFAATFEMHKSELDCIELGMFHPDFEVAVEKAKQFFSEIRSAGGTSKVKTLIKKKRLLPSVLKLISEGNL